jgi:hypothetical protein
VARQPRQLVGEESISKSKMGALQKAKVLHCWNLLARASAGFGKGRKKLFPFSRNLKRLSIF